MLVTFSEICFFVVISSGFHKSVSGVSDVFVSDDFHSIRGSVGFISDVVASTTGSSTFASTTDSADVVASFAIIFDVVSATASTPTRPAFFNLALISGFCSKYSSNFAWVSGQKNPFTVTHLIIV